MRDPLEVTNPQNKALYFIEYKNAVPAAHKAHHFSITRPQSTPLLDYKAGQPMFLGTYSSCVVKKPTKRTNELCGQDAKFLKVETRGLYCYHQARTNPGCLVARATKFVQWHLIFHRIYCSFFPLCTKICVSSHAPSRKRQITVRFVGHYRIVGHQWETCCMSYFWCLAF
jgi:hypothetical protein